MLSYKFKHLCSRVIASLSAFGLFTVSANDAKAADGEYIYYPGDTYGTYAVAGDAELTAKYWELALDACQLSNNLLGRVYQHVDASGDATPAVSLGVDANGKSYCKWMCPSGFLSEKGGQNYVTGMIVSGVALLTTGCVYVADATCEYKGKNTGESSNYVSQLGTFTPGYIGGVNGVSQYAKCTFTCEEGYRNPDEKPMGKCADGQTTGCGEGASSVSGIIGGRGLAVNTESDASSVWYTATGCVATKHVVEFDCEEGTVKTNKAGNELISSGYYIDGNKVRTDYTYGESFKIPDVFWCERGGFEFSGWASPVKLHQD